MNNKIRFEYRDIDLLVPYARNARIHTDEQVAGLAGSIREFGFNVPVLIDDDNNIMAGHGRVLAARKLDMKEVPVVIASHLTDIQRRAFILADNKLHDNSSFDFELLNIELEELKDDGFDLKLAGFADFELETHEQQSIIDDLEVGSFASSVRESSDNFDMTFVFPKSELETFERYFQTNSKNDLTNQIVELVRAGGSVDAG